MMLDPNLLSQTGNVLSKGMELMSNPAIGGAVTGLIGWMKGLFKNNKRALERLAMVEKAEADEKTIEKLTNSLEDEIYENEELQKQFAEELKKVEAIMKKEGVTNITKTNTINTTNSTNTKIAQDINIKGDIIIN